jgi:hypothetical protein
MLCGVRRQQPSVIWRQSQSMWPSRSFRLPSLMASSSAARFGLISSMTSVGASGMKTRADAGDVGFSQSACLICIAVFGAVSCQRRTPALTDRVKRWSGCSATATIAGSAPQSLPISVDEAGPFAVM